jgi:hypothetical protein
VPITPCRLIDTRPGQHHVGPYDTFGVADTKTVAATGTNGDCTIPVDAVGLSLNVTAVGATAPTFLTIWPDGAVPTASSLNPFPGEPPTPNAVNTDLSGTGTFNIYNLAGAVNVIVDVNGYYTAATLQEIHQRLSALERAQPFALSHSTGTARALGTTPSAVESVTIDAPVAGYITVVSTALVQHSVAGGDVRCVITSAANIPGTIGIFTPSVQWFEGTGSSELGSLSGTERFETTSRQADEYVLACEESIDGGIVLARNLVAIFTPAQ